MNPIEWVKDPEDLPDEHSQLAKAGEIVIGNVRRSRSGRTRWELAMLPGISVYRDDFKGWAEGEQDAKRTIETMWQSWCERAGLIGTR